MMLVNPIFFNRFSEMHLFLNLKISDPLGAFTLCTNLNSYNRVISDLYKCCTSPKLLCSYTQPIQKLQFHEKKNELKGFSLKPFKYNMYFNLFVSGGGKIKIPSPQLDLFSPYL